VNSRDPRTHGVSHSRKRIVHFRPLENGTLSLS
jgi:hypothetical protein